MASYTYPVARPTGTLTTAQIHLLLSNPTVIAKRAAALADQKFIADFLLRGRFNAVGGGIFYETGEELFAADSPEVIAPGSAYPKTVLTSGEIAAAKTDKRGMGTDITDEKISREGISYVNKGLVRLANTVIQDVDLRSMAVIASKVTTSAAASAAWTTPGAVLETLVTQNGLRGDGTGIDLQVIVLKPAKFAKLIGILVDAGAFPREQANIVLSGNLPFTALGYTWVTSPNYLSDNPLFLDADQLGGMADESLQSPEFVRYTGSQVEVSSTRVGPLDKYELRVRRVTVPVVTEPLAGITITGTNL